MLPTLVMLHGSNGSGDTLRPLADALRPHARIETPNLLGHGGRPVPWRFSVREFAEDIIAYLDANKLARVYLFGYSVGGYIALYLARHFPQRIAGVSVLAVKHVFDANTVQHFTHIADAERIRNAAPKRVPELERTHHPQDWVTITTNNKILFEELGTTPAVTTDDLRAVSMPALIFSADQDQLVPVHETLALGRMIAGSKVILFPGQAHPLGACPIPDIAAAMGEWLKQSEAASQALWSKGNIV